MLYLIMYWRLLMLPSLVMHLGSRKIFIALSALLLILYMIFNLIDYVWLLLYAFALLNIHYNPFWSCKQFWQHSYIVYIGTRYFHMMYQFRVLIYSDMSLIYKMPSVSFFHIMNVRVSFLLLVFGRWCCCYHRRIYNRSFFQNQSLFC